MESSISNALIIFVRNTELGKVKTRLSKDLGDEKTLAVYKYLLQYTAEIAASNNCHLFVFYSDYIHLNDGFDDECFTKFLQAGDNLGERMQDAFNKIFALGHKNVCVIGSDCYMLEVDHLLQAFKSLEENDAVIGPATDGGYYLLGMKQTHSFLFENKMWGTSTIFEDTIKDLSQHNFKYHELEKLDDIDTIEDLLSTDILANLSLEE